MTNSNMNTSEKYIAKEFDKDSESFDKKDNEKLSSTAQRHVDKISIENTFDIALDVGSGTAGIVNAPYNFD